MLLLPIGLDQPQTRFPVATILIALATVVVFVLTNYRADAEQITLLWGFLPGFESLSTLFSSMFLHGGLGHLLSNLLFFILPAMKVEDVIGSWRFFLFYIFCGITASLAYVLMQGGLPIPVVGASGAISGVVAAFMFLYPNSRITFWVFPLLLPLPRMMLLIRLRTWFFLGFWFLKEFISAYFLKVAEIDSSVAVWAHIGGFLFGAASMWCFYGWDGGLGGELRQGALRFLGRMKNSLFFQRRYGHRAGIALQAIPVLYALIVFADGGLIHPQRPNSWAEQRLMLARKIASGQTAETLMDKALRNGELNDSIHRMRREEFHKTLQREIPGRAELHLRIRAKQINPPPEMIGDPEHFWRDEFPKFPQKCQISVPEVELLSVLYTPSLKYEIFCGTNLSSHEVFEKYLKALDERNWAVDSPLFDETVNAGMLSSFDGEWSLSIFVAPSTLGAGKTMVLWLMERIQ